MVPARRCCPARLPGWLAEPHVWCRHRQQASGSGAEAAAALEARLAEAVQIRGLLARNTEEVDGLLRALGGEYVPPEAGGDLLRDGAGVLPTGAAAPGQEQTPHALIKRHWRGADRQCTSSASGPRWWARDLSTRLQLRSRVAQGGSDPFCDSAHGSPTGRQHLFTSCLPQ